MENRYEILRKIGESDAQDLAYMAGLVDGEGCIHINHTNIGSKKSTLNYCLRITVGNTDIKMLKFCKKKFGGNLHKRSPRKNPNITGRLPSYKWYLCGKNAGKLVELIFPYLITKKEKAKIALEFMKTFEENRVGKGKIDPIILKKRKKLKRQIQKLTRSRGFLNRKVGNL